MSAAPTVLSLQRELLAICKGSRVDWQMTKRVHEIRCQLYELDQNAALYFGWWLDGDRLRAETEFFADYAKRKGDTPCET